MDPLLSFMISTKKSSLRIVIPRIGILQSLHKAVYQAVHTRYIHSVPYTFGSHVTCLISQPRAGKSKRHVPFFPEPGSTSPHVTASMSWPLWGSKGITFKTSILSL